MRRMRFNYLKPKIFKLMDTLEGQAFSPKPTIVRLIVRKTIMRKNKIPEIISIIVRKWCRQFPYIKTNL